MNIFHDYFNTIKTMSNLKIKTTQNYIFKFESIKMSYQYFKIARV